MSGNGYLFAAYAATWIIHLAYLRTIVARYAGLKREIDSLQKIKSQNQSGKK
jgi:CcmD family protein